jgi:two-component system, NarL family, sensor kinase
VPAALALTGIALSLSRPRFDDLVTGHEIGDALMAIACGVVAALILRRRPRQPVGVLFAIIAVADAVSVLNSGLTDSVSASGTGPVWLLWFEEWTWIPGLLLTVTVLPLVFPEGVRTVRQRLLLRAEVAAVVVVCVTQSLGPHLSSGPHSQVANPVAVPGFGLVGGLTLVAALALALVSLAILVVRLLRADERLRLQLLPLFAAGVVVIGATIAAVFLGTAGVVLQDGCYLLIPAAALFAVLRLRLYDLELALGRIAGWLLLSGLLVGGYVLVVQVAAGSLDVHGRAASIVATAAVALAFGPLHALLQRGIARWLYGDRGDPYAALSHTTQVLSAGADPAGALQRAADDLAHRLRSPGVRIVRGSLLLAGHTGGVPALVVPLRAGADEVGRLEILPRTPGESFSRGDERLILDLCAPVTNAVAAIGLADELQASRERLALAREAERRRVRGELHDDVGPSLAAAAIQAQTALRRLQREDTVGVAAALEALRVTIRHASEDLRSAIDALGPRVLDEVGLADALRALALAGEPPATVEITALPGLPAAVEVAVYRVAAEALTNARRHARASLVVVRLASVDDQLALSVRDDGVGGATSRPGGVGIGSMRARIEELGGSFFVGPGDHGAGTLVSVSVPLASSPLAVR